MRSAACCFAAALLALVGCASPPDMAANTPAASQPETAVPQPRETLSLPEAYRLDDPLARREAVIDAAGRLLREQSLPVGDGDASAQFTELAFSSGALYLPDPGFIRQGAEAAVAGLPDGLGLFLYDLNSDAPPVEVSRWTVGLSALSVTWGDSEAGIAYSTLGDNGIERVHFALVTLGEDGWQLSWLSDEAPDWWFNAVGGNLQVEPDLSRLAVVGQADDTTGVFYEIGDAPRRTFRVGWVREMDGYQLSPLVESYPSRVDWLHSVAEPSPYTSLVAFIERLQALDESGAARLVTDETLLNTAVDLGLHRSGRRYQIVSVEDDAITFRDLDGAYRAAFRPPGEGGGDWLISVLSVEESLEVQPTPEPEE